MYIDKSVPKIVLKIETSMAYGRGILKGIAKYSRIHGPWIFYSEPGDKETSLPEFGKWDIDGIISHTTSEKEARKILSSGLPVVFKGLETPPDDLNCVVSDCKSIGEMGAEYFLEKGFHNFAYCGYNYVPWSASRGKSFGDRIRKAGYKIHYYQPSLSSKNSVWEREQKQLADWVKSLPKPIAVMACHDVRARHIIEACRGGNINIPNDVAVLGVDNDDVFCDLSNPNLSSIELNTTMAGYKAAALLSRLMRGDNIKGCKIKVEPKFVVTRQSTDKMAIEDKYVLEALDFIHKHAKENIQVSDVTNAIGISRTAIQNRFRIVVGRTIYDEIKRIRIELIASMLRETDMSIEEIALELGFSCGKHISRYFSQKKGVSPMKYRYEYKL